MKGKKQDSEHIEKPNTWGHWTERKRRTTTLVCPSCSGRYIKTRPGQTTCLRCVYSGLSGGARKKK
ncbi:MAG TPA: hypothetical protein VG934_02630 [Candidatus Paceibacterota bacterium]|nr:hypothetical protein [Candidatus Paceibacterota bacterium]